MLAVGLSPSTKLGLSPALIHIVNHALIKGCMFMTACAFIYQFGLWDIRDFEGLGRRMPYTCMALLLAILGMIGMPPSAGFVTKWYLILAALDAEKYQFVAVILLSTLLMIVYFWRLIESIYVRSTSQSGGAFDLSIQEAPASMLFPSIILGVSIFAVGIVWMAGILTPILDAVNSSFGLGGR
jgi:multicomponent Na+:H+ antiporter subunit D